MIINKNGTQPLTITLRGKEYIVDNKLKGLHLKENPIEFLPFFNLTEEEEFQVHNILHNHKKGID